MNKDKEREQLIYIIKRALDLNIDNCNFCKKLYKDNKDITKVLNKSIKQSKKGIEKVSHIKHLEILRSIYGDMVGKVSSVLMLGGSILCSKKLDYYDKTENGFKEFTEIQEMSIKEQQEKAKQQQEYREMVKKAKENGDKVDFMLDPKDNKVKPIVVKKGDNNA